MDKSEYYLDIALTVAKKSTCLKKHYGAVIVNNDEIVATGFNGPPRKEEHCITCTKKQGNGDMDEYCSCPAVHAEMNAIISAARREMVGADIYLAGFDVRTNEEYKDAWPCEICLRLIKNAGINRIINRTGVIYQRDKKTGILDRWYFRTLIDKMDYLNQKGN
ncbi:MAG: cytidine deaminase [Lachnospiraceae bacterium]|nr:cytidine deaminase [Lachnospiraceae bacterium]